MILGGGHQLDLDLKNDWGDPWVQRAIVWRMQLGALSNRIYPIAGLHCYDEPGLTWWPTPDTNGVKGDLNPFSIPHQLEEFKRLTGKSLPFGPSPLTLPQYAKDPDSWLAFMEMRMKYLEQAWNASVWGTNSVYPPFNTINQVSSSYAMGDTTDGVDGRQSRPYSVISGHGGYSDLPFGTMQPIKSLEASWAFSREKPHIYTPAWYAHSWPTMRNAMWLSWATKLDGMIYTPDVDFAMSNAINGYYGSEAVFEIAEINRRLALVGDAIRQVKKQYSPVAVIHSSRQMAMDIAQSNSPELAKVGVPHYVSPHADAVNATYWRIMETGVTPEWIDESEAVDRGVSFLKQWKVLYVPRLTTATPEFRRVLEAYAVGGGGLVQFKDDALELKGATRADYGFGMAAQYAKDNISDPQNAPASATDLAWRDWNNKTAPTFAADLNQWLGPRTFTSSNPEVFVNAHSAGAATYLLIANNAMDKVNPRGVKHELIPAATEISVPSGGVIYDLFNGGIVPQKGGKVQLKLPAGDGACLLRLPSAPGKLRVAAQPSGTASLKVDVAWGTVGYLPFRLRLFDPSGQRVAELFRATSPQGNATRYSHVFDLGENHRPGVWRVEVAENLTDQVVEAQADLRAATSGKWAEVDNDAVSIYFDDAARIHDLLAGKAAEPEYSRLNWDAKRVFNLDTKKFAIFGPAAAAERLAGVLRAKGMTVEINPAYEIVPFKQEENRGGAGPIFRERNFENIYAHTIVLPGHPLAKASTDRGHINRLVTETFPGAGRTFIQWGSSCYQAGWQNIFVFGDTEKGVQYLLDVLNGKNPAAQAPVEATVQKATLAAPRKLAPRTGSVTRQIRSEDTPVGVALSPDGTKSYTLLLDGTAAAYGATGKALWQNQELMIGSVLALSPDGQRVAIGGFPGITILDAASGKTLGTYKTESRAGSLPTPLGNQIVSLAWNDKSTLLAGGWQNSYEKTAIAPVLLEANGAVRPLPAGINGGVMGVKFVPGTDTLLLGADKLTAVNAATGAQLWSVDMKGAGAFAISPDGKTLAAGGWGRTAGIVDLADGKLRFHQQVAAIVGGAAFLPNGDVTIAVWGSDNALQVWRAATNKLEPFFQSGFGFQDVQWSQAHNALVAAEQGGRLWLLEAQGKPLSVLDETHGTTAYRMSLQGGQLIVGRMNRVVQQIKL
jgi:WD40 repeat protein